MYTRSPVGDHSICVAVVELETGLAKNAPNPAGDHAWACTPAVPACDDAATASPRGEIVRSHRPLPLLRNIVEFVNCAPHPVDDQL